MKEEGDDRWYVIEKATLPDGGEYECDWSAENDETNHYVNVIGASCWEGGGGGGVGLIPYEVSIIYVLFIRNGDGDSRVNSMSDTVL